MNKTIKALLDSGNEAIIAFTKRDLLGEKVNIKKLWIMPEVLKTLKKQKPNGSWTYPNKKVSMHSPTDYNQYQTYKTMAELIELYGLSKEHEAIKKAAQYLFSFQTKKGEFRGIYGNQYSPNYSASITEFLIKAGYKESRIKNTLNWLLSIRQDDGGWAIPFRTKNKMIDAIKEKKTIEPDKTKPFSHMVTGIVLRPFSLMPEYRKKVKKAGLLLATRVFKRDKYPDRLTPAYWTKFSFPYHWTDILSTFDALTLIGIKDHSKVKEIINWFTKHKKKNGLYDVKIMTGAKYKDVKYWITLQYLKILKRL